MRIDAWRRRFRTADLPRPCGRDAAWCRWCFRSTRALRPELRPHALLAAVRRARQRRRHGPYRRGKVQSIKYKAYSTAAHASAEAAARGRARRAQLSRLGRRCAAAARKGPRVSRMGGRGRGLKVRNEHCAGQTSFVLRWWCGSRYLYLSFM